MIAGSDLPRPDWALLDALTALASQAARAVLDIRANLGAPTLKADRSPVTAADLAAQRIILAGLAGILPRMPVVSEEALPAPGALTGDCAALVDPLDGTKEFIAGRDEFTINIALVRDREPALGIVLAPARGLVWRGIPGLGAERLRLAAGAGPADATERTPLPAQQPLAKAAGTGLVAATSRSHRDAATARLLGRLAPRGLIECGSALKFGLVAEGSADVYPRLSPTCEWDIAAGHAVVVAAGGAVVAPDGSPLTYLHQEKDFRVAGFIASADPALIALATEK